MAGIFGNATAEFQVIGELVDRRIITSPKMPDWKLHIFKVAARGCTLEIEVSQEVYDKGVLESAYHLIGNLGVEANRTKLRASEVKLIKPTAASA